MDVGEQLGNDEDDLDEDKDLAEEEDDVDELPESMS